MSNFRLFKLLKNLAAVWFSESRSTVEAELGNWAFLGLSMQRFSIVCPLSVRSDCICLLLFFQIQGDKIPVQHLTEGFCVKFTGNAF